MDGNVVSILVRAADGTKEGFGSAKAGAESTAASMEELAAATDRASAAETEFRAAQAEAAGAAARLDELQQAGTASADELAAAQDRVTTATLASIDAQVRLGEADARVTRAQAAQGAAAEETAAKTDAAGGLMAGAGAKVKMAALGVAVGMGLAVRSAAGFQQQTVRLVTSAGESAKSLGMVQQGILALSSQTATSSSQLASGMYMIESAGFHGAQGLTVLKAAAQGAKAEGADLGEVANAVTSGLNAYGLKARDATAFTDMMVAAVGQGKMTMQDLASSLSAVLPIAASAHISFAQVGGAIATMTAQGMSARQASQDLANSIRALLNPNSVAINEMNQFGISSVDVANKLGQRGLTGTIGYLADAIAKRMGPSGDVILSTFNKSQTAAADAETMLRSLPPAIQDVAKAYLDGSITQKQWTNDLKAVPPLQANLAREFGTVANRAHGFNQLLTSGSPQAQTFAAALGKMMGGATGLNTALMLTGSHAATFASNVRAVGDSARGAGADVAGWNDITKETAFQEAKAKDSVEAAGTSLGLALLPAVNAVLGPLSSLLGFVAQNKAAADAFAIVVGGVLAGALGGKLVGALSSLKGGISAVIDVAQNIPSAISSVMSFASSAVESLGKAMAATGAWIAEHAVATAEFIAQNAAQAASATAAFIAENAATLGIAAAIALLVAAIIYLATHWKQVWGAVREVALATWHFLDDDFLQPVERGVGDLVRWIDQHWRLLATILATVLLGPVGGLIAFIATHWRQFTALTSRLVDDVTGFFRSLPGRIIGALAALPGMLFSAGVHAVSMFVDGLKSIPVVGPVIGWGESILSHLPHSPAKQGPLSGSGSPDIAGRKIAQMLAQGMTAGAPDVRAAAARIAGAAGPGGAYGAYGGPGAAAGAVPQHLIIELRASDSRILSGLQATVRAAGGDPQMFIRKVAFA